MSTRLERLRQLDGDTVRNFMLTRKGDMIEEDLREYILQLNSASSIIHFQGASLTRVTRALRLEWPAMTYSEARTVYYDALQFFYIDDNISAEAWDNYYADRMEDIFRLAVKMNRLDIALKASAKAHEYRTRNRDVIRPGDWQPPVFIVSEDVDFTRMGYRKKSVYEAVRRNEKKQLGRIIGQLPVTDRERERLRSEAGVDAEYEEVTDDGAEG